MKIIGHRGAAGTALENSLDSIRHAREADVDAIEIDIRLTADKHFVVCHDATTKRVSSTVFGVHDETIAVLSRVILHNGELLPSLADALKAAKDTPVVIEVKGGKWAKELAKFLKSYTGKPISVIAMDHKELAKFHKLAPNFDTYAVQKFHATEVFEAFKFAEKEGFKGLDINFWLLNPVTYWLARRSKLKLIVYTVNSPWMAAFLNRLFPEIIITTNYPKRMHFLRKGK